jgi:hypothetical protein
MLCPFCFSNSKKSKEHYFSQPICDAMGIDRSVTIVSLDARTAEYGAALPLSQRSVRLPCESCNSTWMNQLEHETAAALEHWMRGADRTLSAHEIWTIKRWATKTAFVLAFGELDARRFVDAPTETAIPDITTAKAVRNGGSLDHVTIGVARTTGSPYIWGAGNPTVIPSGPDQTSCRAVNVAAVNLGTLQLWVVIPVLPPERVELPPGVLPLGANLPFGLVRFRPGDDIDPMSVCALYPRRAAGASSTPG